MGIHVFGLEKAALTKRENLTGYFFVLLTFLGFVFFVLGPMVAAVVLSFCSSDRFTPPKFAGLSNYRALIRDDHLLGVYRNTFILMGGVVGF